MHEPAASMHTHASQHARYSRQPTIHPDANTTHACLLLLHERGIVGICTPGRRTTLHAPTALPTAPPAALPADLPMDLPKILAAPG